MFQLTQKPIGIAIGSETLGLSSPSFMNNIFSAIPVPESLVTKDGVKSKAALANLMIEAKLNRNWQKNTLANLTLPSNFLHLSLVTLPSPLTRNAKFEEAKRILSLDEKTILDLKKISRSKKDNTTLYMAASLNANLFNSLKESLGLANLKLNMIIPESLLLARNFTVPKEPTIIVVLTEDWLQTSIWHKNKLCSVAEQQLSDDIVREWEQDEIKPLFTKIAKSIRKNIQESKTQSISKAILKLDLHDGAKPISFILEEELKVPFTTLDPSKLEDLARATSRFR